MPGTNHLKTRFDRSPDNVAIALAGFIDVVGPEP
jgi:hypothetical protein